MIIKIQDQDLLLLEAHVYPNYPGVFPPPPSLFSMHETFLDWREKAIKNQNFNEFFLYNIRAWLEIVVNHDANKTLQGIRFSCLNYLALLSEPNRLKSSYLHKQDISIGKRFVINTN